MGDPDAWLVEMDRFGILSQRIVLLDAFTVEQNLALPFTLEVEQLSESVREKVYLLASEVGLGAALLPRPASGLDADTQLRLRLGKSLALGPRILLAEHPNATLPADAALRFAADLKRIAKTRELALVVMTADSSFARAVSNRTLTLAPASGQLLAPPKWRNWF
jgi:ABC-type lipoprotein export system ATPase subunit